jgi:hypothetical protein
MTLLASVFSGFAMLFGGLFGGHHMPPATASSTPPHWMTSSTTPPVGGAGGWGTTTPGHMGMMPGIFGKVVSISGTTLTVTGKADMQSATTTYSVDASSAKIIKGGVTGAAATAQTVADIKTGDMVMVAGTVTGTNIVAKTILDGIRLMAGPEHEKMMQMNMHGPDSSMGAMKGGMKEMDDMTPPPAGQ